MLRLCNGGVPEGQHGVDDEGAEDDLPDPLHLHVQQVLVARVLQPE